MIVYKVPVFVVFFPPQFHFLHYLHGEKCLLKAAKHSFTKFSLVSL